MPRRRGHFLTIPSNPVNVKFLRGLEPAEEFYNYCAFTKPRYCIPWKVRLPVMPSVSSAYYCGSTANST